MHCSPSFLTSSLNMLGGITGLDGCVYAPPYTATGVLRINPNTDSVNVIGNYPESGWKWHGGLLAKSTGVIYAFPAHSNEVLCIDTNPREEDNDDDQSWRVTRSLSIVMRMILTLLIFNTNGSAVVMVPMDASMVCLAMQQRYYE